MTAQDITPVALLLTAVTALSSFVVSLILYVKEMHKKHESRIELTHQEHKKDLVQILDSNNNITTKFTEHLSHLENSNDRLIDVLDKNTDTLNDLHKYIISDKKQ